MNASTSPDFFTQNGTDAVMKAASITATINHREPSIAATINCRDLQVADNK
jgi:hypothetical protein